MSELVIQTPGVCGGKPRFADRRIQVQDIAVMRERLGYTPDEIADYFGSLSLAEVYGALPYYHEHREQVDSDIAEDEALVATTAEAGLIGATDEAQLGYCRQARRVIVTRDAYFLRLDAADVHDGGIVFCISTNLRLGYFVPNLVLIRNVVTAEEASSMVEFL